MTARSTYIVMAGHCIAITTTVATQVAAMSRAGVRILPCPVTAKREQREQSRGELLPK